MPELPWAEGADPPRFRIELAGTDPPEMQLLWAHNFPDPSGQSTLVCERTATDYRLHFPSVATVVAFADGKLRIHPESGACMDSVRHILLDQALPRLLAQRGELVLHAALVATSTGKALLLIGDSGRGKSTLTGAFLASGRRVGTDDGAVVRISEGELVAVPTYTSLRLLTDSRAHFFAGVDAATLPAAGYGGKKRLPVPIGIDASRVEAIVLLDPPIADGASPRLTRELPASACMAMIRHGFQLDLSDTGNLQVLLAKAAEAAGLVPVYRLEYPRQFDALPDVIALLEHELG